MARAGSRPRRRSTGWMMPRWAISDQLPRRRRRQPGGVEQGQGDAESRQQRRGPRFLPVHRGQPLPGLARRPGAICALSASMSSKTSSSRRKEISATSIALAVKIAVEVEEIGLEQLLRRIEHRPDAEIGDAVEDAAVRQPSAHRIDAEARAQIVAERDVGGRKAELAAALVAMLDHALDRERPGEQARRRSRSRRPAAPRGSGSRRPARSPSITGATVSTDRRLAWPSSFSTSTSPPRPLPKVKSSPVTTPAAPIRRTSQSVTKSGAVTAANSASNWKTSIASTPAASEQPLALVERGQPERAAGPGLKIAHRMGIEGGDQRRPALGAGAIDGAADHRLVALVKSVEIAERDDAAAKMGRNRRAPVQALHRTAIG